MKTANLKDYRKIERNRRPRHGSDDVPDRQRSRRTSTYMSEARVRGSAQLQECDHGTWQGHHDAADSPARITMGSGRPLEAKKMKASPAIASTDQRKVDAAVMITKACGRHVNQGHLAHMPIRCRASGKAGGQSRRTIMIAQNGQQQSRRAERARDPSRKRQCWALTRQLPRSSCTIRPCKCAASWRDNEPPRHHDAERSAMVITSSRSDRHHQHKQRPSRART